MATIPKMKYVVKEEYIEVQLPLTSRGKFRCKKRKDIQEFGEGFAPKSNPITSDSYLEWQIGYDTVIGKYERATRLNKNKFKFTGANGKQKHPYELSEITYYMCEKGIISKEELMDVYNQINGIKKYLQDLYPINVVKEKDSDINKIRFLTSSTRLPTFIRKNKDSKLLVEIMIQKQQYATGVQPMLYLDIPVNAFSNSEDIINKTSSETPYGIVHFDSSLKETIFNIWICFSMCSESHNHDVKEILKVIINAI